MSPQCSQPSREAEITKAGLRAMTQSLPSLQCRPYSTVVLDPCLPSHGLLGLTTLTCSPEIFQFEHFCENKSLIKSGHNHHSFNSSCCRGKIVSFHFINTCYLYSRTIVIDTAFYVIKVTFIGLSDCQSMIFILGVVLVSTFHDI